MTSESLVASIMVGTVLARLIFGLLEFVRGRRREREREHRQNQLFRSEMRAAERRRSP